MTVFDATNEALRECLDPVVFISRFISLPGKEGMIPWKESMDEYQKKILRDTTRFRIVNKSKKTGISTTIAGGALQKAFIKANIDEIIVATGERVAGELLSKIGALIESMPRKVQVAYQRNVERILLKNNARLIALPSYKPANIRGYGMKGETDIYIDEFAHVNNDEEIWVVARDFMILGGKATLISTPMGKRGKFYEIVSPLQAVYRKEIRASETIWSYHEIHYTKCPRLVAQEAILKSDVDDIHFNQEYCCEFIDEAVSFYPYGLIMPCVEDFEKNGRELSEYGERSDKITYVGIDLAEKVNETALIVVEKMGRKFIVKWLKTLPGADYATVQIPYFTTINASFNPLAIKIDELGPGEGIVSVMEKEIGGKVWGYPLSGKFKEILAVRLRMLMEAHLIELPRDMKLIDQIHSVERTTTSSGMHARYTGKRTGNDDLVWALALAVYEEVEMDEDSFIGVLEDDKINKLVSTPDWGDILQRQILEHREDFDEELTLF